MTLQEFYARTGGDFSETLSRLPSEALIKKFVLKYPGDGSFSMLKDSIEKKDWETAFRAAHTLKGVAQNLGFGNLYRAAAPLTEAMRGGNALADPSLYEATRAAHEELLAAIGELA